MQGAGLTDPVPASGLAEPHLHPMIMRHRTLVWQCAVMPQMARFSCIRVSVWCHERPALVLV
jgi:hypothetical protein